MTVFDFRFYVLGWSVVKLPSLRVAGDSQLVVRESKSRTAASRIGLTADLFGAAQAPIRRLPDNRF